VATIKVSFEPEDGNQCGVLHQSHMIANRRQGQNASISGNAGHQERPESRDMPKRLPAALDAAGLYA